MVANFRLFRQKEKVNEAFILINYQTEKIC